MSGKVTKYDYPQSHTGGVKPMNIRGVFEDERYRLSEEFTDEERKLRNQWLKDQELSPNEPRPVPEEYIKETRNPIRRFLSKPWQLLEDKMTPVFGRDVSALFRGLAPKFLVGIGLTYFAWYHWKYNQNDWTSAKGVNILITRPMALPGEKHFPSLSDRFEPADYDDRGFKARKVFLD